MPFDTKSKILCEMNAEMDTAPILLLDGPEVKVSISGT